MLGAAANISQVIVPKRVFWEDCKGRGRERMARSLRWAISSAGKLSRKT